MRDLILMLIGWCGGTILGILLLFAIMGQKLRDQFFGRNLENKPVVIDWIDGHTKDFQITMRNVPVFTGVIRSMTLSRDINSASKVDISLMSKAEVVREFRY